MLLLLYGYQVSFSTCCAVLYREHLLFCSKQLSFRQNASVGDKYILHNGLSLRAENCFFLFLFFFPLWLLTCLCDIINPSLLNEYLDNESKSAGGVEQRADVFFCTCICNYIYMYCCMYYICSCNFSTVIAGDDECVKFWPESTKKLYALAWEHPYMTICLFLEFLDFMDFFWHFWHTLSYCFWVLMFHFPWFFPPTLNSYVIHT